MSRKILFICPQPFFQWRGSPIRVKFNLLALTELGYKIDLLTLPIGEDMPFERVRVYRVANPFKVKNIPIGPSLWKIFFDILLIFKGLSLCRKHRYDVIHGVEEGGFIATILAKFFRTKAIFEKHSDPLSYKKGKLRNMFLKAYSSIEVMSVKNAIAVIGTGPGLVDQVNRMKTATRAFNIFDIPSSLNESTVKEVEKIRLELKKASDELLITFVGSFAVYQGVDLLFSAIPEVVRLSDRARFIIIGGNTEEIAEQRLALQKGGVDANVTFLGKIAPDILPDYLAASDILLSPRVSGVNTPLKILDYLKAGRSIVATDLPSNKLLLNDQNAVFSYPDAKSFAAAIVSLITNESKRLRFGENCRQVYERAYTFNHHCERLADCYDYVLAFDKNL
jgi:glycosyltransferase involved in cell wall biosynthesis